MIKPEMKLEKETLNKTRQAATVKKRNRIKEGPKLLDLRDGIRLVTVLLFLPWITFIPEKVFGMELEFELELAVVMMFLIFGSFWCGWICPFGNADYFISRIGKTLFPSLQFNLPHSLDRPLRYLKYIFLGAFLYIFISQGINYFLEDHMVMYHSTLFSSIYITVKKGLILLLPLFIPRFFCKYICFQKAGYNLINRILPLTTIKRDSSECIQCQRCDTTCPMGIKISQLDTVTGRDCIGCYSCIDKGVCPDRADALHLTFLGTRVNPLVFSLSAIIFYYLITWTLHISQGQWGL